MYLRYHHNVHKAAEERIIKSLEDRGIETRKVQRYGYAPEHPDWADVIVTAGINHQSVTLNFKRPILP